MEEKEPFIRLSGLLSHFKYNDLINEIPFEQNTIIIRGKECKEGRLTCFLSNENKSYYYSGSYRSPTQMPKIVSKIMEEGIKIINESKEINDVYKPFKFNSCLANYYRDGNDSVGKHSDNEKSLVDGSSIMSISFGATRKFRFHEKNRQIEFNINHGDILLMLPGCQDRYLHEVPKQLKIKEPRINLTFRFYK